MKRESAPQEYTCRNCTERYYHAIPASQKSKGLMIHFVEAFSKGVLAFGPFAADGLFAGGGYAKYDGILAMYHDQGLAPFKSLSPDGVNFTAGLSAVRTSPDHGTAFDIAGKDKADPQSMRNAIYAAIDIAEHRRAWAEWTRNPLQRAERDRGGRDVSGRDLPQTEKED